MAHFIKWRLSAEVPRVHTSEPFGTKKAAIDAASVLLRVKTHELWVEDGEGQRTEADEIRRICGQWGQQRIAG